MSNEIVNTFLQNMADTATAMELDAHLNLISKDVQLLGFPGFDVINFNDWATQCKREFAEGFIKDVSYEGLKIITQTEKRIMFKTIELVEATDGTKNIMGIEVVIEQEQDNQWRITRERILPVDEVKQDKSTS